MEKKLVYLTVERIIEYNILAINIIKIKKADKAEVLSKSRLIDIVSACEELEGDVYDKAVFLLKSLIQKHPFASGNRRTALIAVKDFLLSNNEFFGIKDDPEQARVMIGIREKFYKDEELKEWLKYGKIKKFER
ncbi:MAG: type II toxin-antitoxin system death-on-curing family toxin [Nanoarchaeota archaeon]